MLGARPHISRVCVVQHPCPSEKLTRIEKLILSFCVQSTIQIHSSNVSIHSYLLSKMGKSGKGRVSGVQRKQINQRAVCSAMEGEMEDVTFARVLKHLGAGHVRVILPNKREGIAKIRTVLTKRGSTPIVSDDIVVLSGRDFETKTSVKGDGTIVEKVDRYDLLGVLSRVQAAKMEKEGKIPSWFITSDEREGEEDIFDYSEDIPDEDVDVDAI